MELLSKYSGGCLFLSLRGELDHHGARDMNAKIGELIEEHLPLKCAVDFSAVPFMDSSGIAVLLYIHRRLSEYGGTVTAENLSKQTMRVISAAGIDRLIPCEMR